MGLVIGVSLRKPKHRARRPFAPLWGRLAKLKTYQRVFVWFGAISLTLSSTGLGFALMAMNQFDQGKTVIETGIEPAAPTVEKESENILLLGTDTRGSGVSKMTTTGNRSDTMMVLHIEKSRESIQVISIPRDTWVSIPGNGKGKINWAMSFGGVPLALKTVSKFLDLEIDHVVMIDFKGVIKLSEVLDGIPIDNPRAFTSDPIVFNFPKGEIVLKGPKALAFVRERHSFKEGDGARIANQQLFIKAVASRILNLEVLGNPSRVLELSNTIGKLLLVDKGLDSSWILNKAVELASFDSENMQFFTVPIAKTGYEPYGGIKHYVLYADGTEVKKMSIALKNDTLDGYQAPPQAKIEN
jgi:LCP family protein required for cell wall assembly